jgi:hypothetical protein
MAGMFDYSPGLAALNSGLDSIGDLVKNYQQQRDLSALGQAIRSGDYGAAAGAALKSGNLGVGLKFLEMDRQKQFLSQPADPSISTSLSFGGGDLPVSTGTKPAPVGGFDNAFNRTLGFEIDPNKPDKITTDNNGAPVKYGINAAAHPNVDLASLDLNGAKDIYKKQYWDILGLDNVEPRLAHVIFDTAVNHGQDTAQKIMDASGGDVNKALALRAADYGRLVATGDPKYTGAANSWAGRIQSLRADVNAPGGGATTGAVVAQNADSEDSASNQKISDLRNQRNYILRQAEALSVREAAGDPLAKGKKEILLKKYDDLGAQVNNLDVRTPDVKPFTDNDYKKFNLDPEEDGKYSWVDGKPTAIGSKPSTGGIGRVLHQGDVLLRKDPLNPHGPPKVVYGTPGLSDQAVDLYANRVAQGDTAAAAGLSKADRAAIANRVGELIDTAPEGAKQILKNKAEQAGLMAGSRTSGQILARVDQYVGEANNAFNIAEQTSAQLPRTQYRTATNLLQMAQNEINDPRLSNHKAAINAVINTYAKAMNPTGPGRIDDKNHARETLDRAQSPDAFAGAVNILRWELEGSKRTAHRLHGDDQPDEELPPVGSTPSTTKSIGIPEAIGSIFGLGQTKFKPVDIGGGVIMRQVR